MDKVIFCTIQLKWKTWEEQRILEQDKD